METAAVDFTVLREFLDYLERGKPRNLAEVDQSKADAFLRSFKRVWPGPVEAVNARSETGFVFLIGLLVGCVTMMALMWVFRDSPEAPVLNLKTMM
jgi:hypothetical protein